MAIDTSQEAEWHWLFKIANVGTDGATTRYFSDEYLAMSDGNQWLGYLNDISAILDQELGPPERSVEIFADLEVTFDDPDQVIYDMITTEFWGNKTVTLYVGQGTTFSDYEEYNTFIVQFPGQYSRDVRTTSIRLRDKRRKDAKNVPTSVYDTTTYPDMSTRDVGKPIAILYGDWRTTAGNGEMVRAVCIKTGAGPRFKICGHAIPTGCLLTANNGKVVKVTDAGETDVTADMVNPDYSLAEFELNATPIDDTTDDVYVNCQGRTNDGTVSGTRIDLLPSIWEDFLKTYLGKVDADIDQTALTQWKLDVVVNGRFWIGEQASSDDILGMIYYDTFSDGDFRGGKYYPIFRSLVADVDALLFTEEDIVDDGSDDDPRPRYRVTTDEELYLNRANYFFRFNPKTGEFVGQDVYEDTIQQTLTGAVKARNLEFRTLYGSSDARNRAAREVVAFGKDVEVLDIELLQRSFLLDLGGVMRLTYDIFDDIQFTIRRLRANLPGMTNGVIGWNIQTIGIGQWTNLTAPVYLSATERERLSQGFWTNLSGEANPGSPNSAVSKYL